MIDPRDRPERAPSPSSLTHVAWRPKGFFRERLKCAVLGGSWKVNSRTMHLIRHPPARHKPPRTCHHIECYPFLTKPRHRYREITHRQRACHHLHVEPDEEPVTLSAGSPSCRIGSLSPNGRPEQLACPLIRRHEPCPPNREPVPLFGAANHAPPGIDGVDGASTAH